MSKISNNEKKLIDFIGEVVKKFQSVLLLGAFVIRTNKGLKNEASYMQSEFRYPYLDIIIRYGEEAVKDIAKKENHSNIERIVIHEMCHAITDPFYDKATERYVTKNEVEMERERLTDHISNIIFKINQVNEIK